MDALAARGPGGARAKAARLGKPIYEPSSIRRKQLQIIRLERPLGRRAHQVTELDGGVARVDRGLFHRLAEKGFGMLDVVLVERVVAGDQHDHRLTVGPPSNAPGLLPEA